MDCRVKVPRWLRVKTLPRLRGEGMKGHLRLDRSRQVDSAAQISVDVPLELCTANWLSGGGEIVNTSFPTYSTVEGPCGRSVGKSISTLCPVTVHSCDPSLFSLICSTEPPVATKSALEVATLVNLSVFPAPALSRRTTFPFLSLNSLNNT